MLRDVRSNVTDGLLGFATATGDGLHIKIGVSPSVTEKPITILGSMGASTIKSKLGLSPLADAVMDAVQGGAARVFCMEEVYGYGSKPRGYGTGNYKASGKLSMLRDDYDDLLAYCKQKGVPFYKMELPSIIVSYANEGARTKIDELKKVKFSKRSNKAAQGDKSLTVDVDMMIVGGVYQDGVAPV